MLRGTTGRPVPAVRSSRRDSRVYQVGNPVHAELPECRCAAVYVEVYEDAPEVENYIFNIFHSHLMSCPCAASASLAPPYCFLLLPGDAARVCAVCCPAGQPASCGGCLRRSALFLELHRETPHRPQHPHRQYLQKGIQARFHQSGTMQRRPFHNAFSPRRAQLSGVMSTPSLRPMRCQ